MSEAHSTFTKKCDACGNNIFMRWSKNTNKYYPANNETGKPDFHNCRSKTTTTPTTINMLAVKASTEQPTSEKERPDILSPDQLPTHDPREITQDDVAFAAVGALRIREAAKRLVESIKTDLYAKADSREWEIMIAHYENILVQLIKK